MPCKPHHSNAPHGAYGFRIIGVDPDVSDLGLVPSTWPVLRVEVRHSTADATEPAGTMRIHSEKAELWLSEGGRIEVFRDPLCVRISTRVPIRPEAVSHPYLGLPAAIAGQWLGRLSFHGGAFVYEGKAWAVLGNREAGKSATLGQLMQKGYPVLADDVVIVEGTTVFSGPRSIDLRGDAAQFLGGEELGFLGNRPRWRLRPIGDCTEVELGGLILLEWGESTCLRPLHAEERLRTLIASSALNVLPEAALPLAELAALPAWRFQRRSGLEHLEAQIDQLLLALKP